MNLYKCDVCGLVLAEASQLESIGIFYQSPFSKFAHKPSCAEITFDICEECQKRLGVIVESKSSRFDPRPNHGAYVRCLVYRLRDLIAANEPIPRRAQRTVPTSDGGQASAIASEHAAA